MDKINLKGAIVADTIRENGKIVAKDVTFKLPDITAMTTEVSAMGTLELPVVGLIEGMEESITKIGADLGLSKLTAFTRHNLEHRWVQTVVHEDGSVSNEGCKAFTTVIPKALPGFSIEIGSPLENELTYTVTRVQVFVGGNEFLLVDRLAQILRIDGVDYMEDIKKLL